MNNKKILIVDDEPHIRLLLEQTLEKVEDMGVELIFADNGEDALEIIKEKRPELVFLDVMIPKMNGFDVCNTVKNELRLKNVYIVMLTAKGQMIDKEKGKEVCVDLYITKPFDPDEIVEKALKILDL
jgi:DNA-binding response OmpR family regulator